MSSKNTVRKWEPGSDNSQIRAVIYVRVSHDPNGTGRSVAEQEAACRKIVHREGWTLIFVYCDEDKSASEDTKDTREKWEKLSAALNRGEFDVLVVWEPSRATRDRQAWAALAYACEVTETRICANGKVYDLDDPDEAFTLDLFFALARRESKVTKKRVARTVNSRAQEGLPGPGKAPFGYRRVYNTSSGAVLGLEPDDASRIATSTDGATETIWVPSKIVQRMYADALKGITAYSIAQSLNQLGIPNPRTTHALEHHPTRERKYNGRWDPGMIRSLLANPAYLGHRSHRGKIVAEGKWPALVDAETFYALANRASKAKFPGPRPASARHLLSRLAICDECSTTLRATTSKGKPGYRCRDGKCYIPISVLDHYITRWVVEWLKNEDNIARLQAAAEVSEEIAHARAEAERYTAELAAVKASFKARQIDLDDYQGVRAELMQLIAEAEERAQSCGIPPLLKAIAGPEAARSFSKLALSTKRETIRTLVEVRLRANGRGQLQLPLAARVILIPLLGDSSE